MLNELIVIQVHVWSVVLRIVGSVRTRSRFRARTVSRASSGLVDPLSKPPRSCSSSASPRKVRVNHYASDPGDSGGPMAVGAYSPGRAPWRAAAARSDEFRLPFCHVYADFVTTFSISRSIQSWII